MITTHAILRTKGLGTLAYAAAAVSLVLALAAGSLGGAAQAAGAATAPSLGTAAAYSVMGKAGVTNGGGSNLSGYVGADLDAAITGFPPGTTLGKVSAPEVNPAQADAAAAYGALTAQAGDATPTGPALVGLTLEPGTYSVGAATLTGVLTLDGAGVYVFLVASDLTSSGTVSLINGADACNVFWQVTSSAAISGGSFVGTIIANTSITFGTGASLNGRALALTGNVTLLTNSISGPSCGQGTEPSATPTTTASPGPSPTATTTATPGGPTETPTVTPTAIVGVPTATATEARPSHVDVEFDCAIDGIGAVRVGLSAGVIVYGLGPDITSGTDTGANKIVRLLPIGSYAWHAIPAPGHYMLGAANGVVNIVACPASSVATAAPGATALSVLNPVSGADLSEVHALATRQETRMVLAAVGLGLVALGFALRRRQAP